MRAHVRSSLGVDTPTPVEQPQEPVARRTPLYSLQALSVMGVAAIPWVPVAAGAYIGERYGSKGWGAFAGFALSFLVLRHTAVKLGGNLT